MVDLILRVTTKSNIPRSRLTSETPPNPTVGCAVPSVLVSGCIEDAQKRSVVVHEEVYTISVVAVPAVNLVKVELKDDMISITGDFLVGLVWVLSCSAVVPCVTSEEFGESSI